MGQSIEQLIFHIHIQHLEEILFQKRSVILGDKLKRKVILQHITKGVLQQTRQTVGCQFGCGFAAGDDHVGVFKVWTYLHDESIDVKLIFGQVYPHFLIQILWTMRIELRRRCKRGHNPHNPIRIFNFSLLIDGQLTTLRIDDIHNIVSIYFKIDLNHHQFPVMTISLLFTGLTILIAIQYNLPIFMHKIFNHETPVEPVQPHLAPQTVHQPIFILAYYASKLTLLHRLYFDIECMLTVVLLKFQYVDVGEVIAHKGTNAELQPHTLHHQG